jgi:hypothetical protein
VLFCIPKEYSTSDERTRFWRDFSLGSFCNSLHTCFLVLERFSVIYNHDYTLFCGEIWGIFYIDVVRSGTLVLQLAHGPKSPH